MRNSQNLPTACFHLIKLLLLPLCVGVFVVELCVGVFVCALSFVPRTPPKDHRFRPRGRLSVEAPYLHPHSFASARVQSRFEFMELGGDMCSNCHRRHWDYRLAPRGTTLYVVLYTRRFAPRAAYAARYACLGRENSVKRRKRRCMLDCKYKLAT